MTISASPSSLIFKASVTIPRRGGQHGYSHAVKGRAGQSSAAVERTRYRDSRTERIRQHTSGTGRTPENECRSTSENCSITESTMGKSKRSEGCPNQSAQASHLGSRSSKYQSGNQSAMGKVEGIEEIALSPASSAS